MQTSLLQRFDLDQENGIEVGLNVSVFTNDHPPKFNHGECDETSQNLSTCSQDHVTPFGIKFYILSPN